MPKQRVREEEKCEGERRGRKMKGRVSDSLSNTTLHHTQATKTTSETTTTCTQKSNGKSFALGDELATRTSKLAKL
jgi:hypothetical protein